MQTASDAGRADYVSEELLTLVSTKCESAKQDLEKNWVYQIISTGVSLGLIFGLGGAISRYLFEKEDYQNLLLGILPLINLYLFMRFGFLASVFSEARTALEKLSDMYFEQHRSIFERLEGEVAPSSVFNTNSYFEYYHRGSTSVGVFLYSLFAPFVLGMSHASSFLLIERILGSGTYFVLASLLYLLPIITLYWGFYIGNRHIQFYVFGKKFNFVLLSIVMSILFGVISFFFIKWLIHQNVLLQAGFAST